MSCVYIMCFERICLHCLSFYFHLCLLHYCSLLTTLTFIFFMSLFFVAAQYMQRSRGICQHMGQFWGLYPWRKLTLLTPTPINSQQWVNNKIFQALKFLFPKHLCHWHVRYSITLFIHEVEINANSEVSMNEGKTIYSLSKL